MRPSRHLLIVATVLLVSAGAYVAWRSTRPSAHQALVDAAILEGKVVVYATTDRRLAQPLIREFERAYPGIRVDYHDINSSDLYRRYRAETEASQPSADVLWSSSMDLQVKLINDGYALNYRSPEMPSLPDWAHWRDEAYGTTFEPIAIVYNKRLVTDKEVPRTHTGLLELLKQHPGKYQDKITTYDVEESGLGYMLATQDSRLNPRFWELIRIMGARDVKLHSKTEAMMDGISSGAYLIGYNMLGSYALTRARKDPAIGVVLTEDYTLIISRLMFISKNAPNPAAAKLWVDFVLSRRGQKLLAEKAGLYSVRKDIHGEASGTALARQLRSSVKPVTVGPGLLAYLDQARRAEFLRQWRQALGREERESRLRGTR